MGVESERSPVFRSEIALRRGSTEASDDNGQKIEMTDPYLETGVNISLFLDVI